MEGKKVFLLVKSMNNSEKKRLKKFLESEYHNKNKFLIYAYEAILLIGKKKELIGTTAMEIKDALGKNRVEIPPNYISRFSLTMSKLAHLIMDFLAIEELKKKTLLKEVNLLNFIEGRGIIEDFDIFFNQAKRKLDKEYHSGETLQWEFQIEASKLRAYSKRDFRISSTNIQETISKLDQAFIAQRLKLVVALLNQSRILNTPFKIEKINNFLLLMEEESYDYSYIKIYNKAFRLLLDSAKIDDFQEYEDLLRKSSHLFSKEERRDLLFIGINFCSRQYQKDQKIGILQLQSELYELGISNKVLLKDGDLSPLDLKNLFFSEIIQGSPLKAQKLLNKYLGLVKRQERPSVEKFCEGVLLFHIKDWDNSLKKMTEVWQLDCDPFFHFDARIFQLKSLFMIEGNSTEDYSIWLSSLLSSAKMYFSRNKKISDHHKNRYNLFVNYLLKLRRIRDKQLEVDHLTLEKLNDQLNSEELVAHKDWLIAQLNKFRKK